MYIKGEMGIGTLIIFIALLLVAAIAAGVLITTNGQLQEKALTTAKEEQVQVGTTIEFVEISGADGSDETIDEMQTMFKLAPGSGEIKLDQVLMTESTFSTSAALTLRDGGENIRDAFTGYYTSSGDAQCWTSKAFESPVSTSFSSAFPSPWTSGMMIGKIAVVLVFPESNGAVDDDHENWTSLEEQYMINGTQDSLNWWSAIEPRADIRHTFEIYRDVPSSYEPITRDNSDANLSLWVNDVFDNMGVAAGGSHILRARAFAEKVRIRNNANWAFIAFMVDSSHTPGGFGGTTTAGFAYNNGPYAAIGSDTFGSAPVAALMAHEYGHIFGAADEYNGACTCTEGSGYFDIINENCDAGCAFNMSSIMRGGAETVTAYLNDAVSPFVLGQMGIIDTDYNNILDPVDLLFEGNSPDLTNSTIISLAQNGYDNPSHSQDVGFFTIEYVHQGSNFVSGNLQRGDVVRMYHESAKDIRSDEFVRLSLMPKTGNVKTAEFITPEVMTEERIYLYPLK